MTYPQPVYTLAPLFGFPPIVTCFGFDGLIETVPRLEPDIYSIEDRDGREIGVARRWKEDWSIEMLNGVTAGPGYIIV